MIAVTWPQTQNTKHVCHKNSRRWGRRSRHIPVNPSIRTVLVETDVNRKDDDQGSERSHSHVRRGIGLTISTFHRELYFEVILNEVS